MAQSSVTWPWSLVWTTITCCASTVFPRDLTFRLMSATTWSLSARIACGCCWNSSNIVGAFFSAATTASRPLASPTSEPRMTASREKPSGLTSPRLPASIALRAISIFCGGVSFVPDCAMLSSLVFEALLQLLRITGNPGFRRPALVVHMEDESLLISVGLPVSCHGIVDERNHVLVVSQDVVDVQPDVLKGLGELSHVAHERVLALEVAAELRAPAAVPDRIIGEQLRNCLEIAAFERLKSVANLLYLLVEAELYSGFCHVRSPLSPFWLDPARRRDDHSSGPDYRLLADRVKRNGAVRLRASTK